MPPLPRHIQQSVKSAVYQKADVHGYMHRDRIANGIFMDYLIQDPEVGGKLSAYMSRNDIKTYIKDAVLNRYSKDKTANQLDVDQVCLIKKIFNQDAFLMEESVSARLSLYRLSSHEILLFVGGTLLKWETALRKALEFVTASPGLSSDGHKVVILLYLATNGRTLTKSDREFIREALRFVGVSVAFSDET